MLRRFTKEDIKKVEPIAPYDSITFGLCTRGGSSARIIGVLEGVPAPLVVEVYGKMENYFIDGSFNQVFPSEMDLFVKSL